MMTESHSRPQIKFRQSSKMGISPDHVFDKRNSIPVDYNSRRTKTEAMPSIGRNVDLNELEEEVKR
jgi:hypothetical protein